MVVGGPDPLAKAVLALQLDEHERKAVVASFTQLEALLQDVEDEPVWAACALFIGLQHSDEAHAKPPSLTSILTTLGVGLVPFVQRLSQAVGLCRLREFDAIIPRMRENVVMSKLLHERYRQLWSQRTVGVGRLAAAVQRNIGWLLFLEAGSRLSPPLRFTADDFARGQGLMLATLAFVLQCCFLDPRLTGSGTGSSPRDKDASQAPPQQSGTTFQQEPQAAAAAALALPPAGSLHGRHSPVLLPQLSGSPQLQAAAAWSDVPLPPMDALPPASVPSFAASALPSAPQPQPASLTSSADAGFAANGNVNGLQQCQGGVKEVAEAYGLPEAAVAAALPSVLATEAALVQEGALKLNGKASVAEDAAPSVWMQGWVSANVALSSLRSRYRAAVEAATGEDALNVDGLLVMDEAIYGFPGGAQKPAAGPSSAAPLPERISSAKAAPAAAAPVSLPLRVPLQANAAPSQRPELVNARSLLGAGPPPHHAQAQAPGGAGGWAPIPAISLPLPLPPASAGGRAARFPPPPAASSRSPSPLALLPPMFPNGLVGFAGGGPAVAAVPTVGSGGAMLLPAVTSAGVAAFEGGTAGGDGGKGKGRARADGGASGGTSAEAAPLANGILHAAGNGVGNALASGSGSGVAEESARGSTYDMVSWIARLDPNAADPPQSLVDRVAKCGGLASNALPGMRHRLENLLERVSLGGAGGNADGAAWDATGELDGPPYGSQRPPHDLEQGPTQTVGFAVSDGGGGSDSVHDLAATRSLWEVRGKTRALYWQSLDAILQREEERLQLQHDKADHSVLLGADDFHRALVGCCLEVVAKGMSLLSLTLPWAIDHFDLQALDLSVAVEPFVQSCPNLPGRLSQHMVQVQRDLLGRLAWRRGSRVFALASARQAAAAAAASTGSTLTSSAGHNASSRWPPPGLGPAPPLPLPMPLPRPDLSDPALPFEGGAGGGVFQSGSGVRRKHPGSSQGSSSTSAFQVGGSASDEPRAKRARLEEAEKAALAATALTQAMLQDVTNGGAAAYGEPLNAPATVASSGTGGEGGASESGAEAEASSEDRKLDALFRGAAALASSRLSTLCLQRLRWDAAVLDQVWTVVRHCLTSHLPLLENRHIDHVVMCSAYAICKVASGMPAEVTFKRIITEYTTVAGTAWRQQPQVQSAGGSDADAVERAARHELIRYYNKVFVPRLNKFVLEFRDLAGQRQAMAQVSSLEDARKVVDGRPSSDPSNEDRRGAAMAAVPFLRERNVGTTASPQRFPPPLAMAQQAPLVEALPAQAASAPIQVGEKVFVRTVAAPVRGGAVGSNRWVLVGAFQKPSPAMRGARAVYSFGQSQPRDLQAVNRVLQRGGGGSGSGPSGAGAKPGQ